MLKIENLVKIYGTQRALDGLSMQINKGALYGFVGPNGAGKTTTIKILAGLIAADSGGISVDGAEMAGSRHSLTREIGYVPDYFGVYDNLMVSEYMEFFASCYGLEGLVSRKRCDTLLTQVGLEDRRDSYVDSLSRGMKQRLCLARALIHDPSLLILDEPTSGLDPKTRLEVKEIIRELNSQGKTILISSHLLSELSSLCTDIGIIEKGRLVMEGSIEAIMNRVDRSNPILISVLEGRETAMSILRSHGLVQTISLKGKEIAIRFTGDARDEAQLLLQLVDAGVAVYGFYREQGSLESLFMQITSHEEKEVVIREGKPHL